MTRSLTRLAATGLALLAIATFTVGCGDDALESSNPVKASSSTIANSPDDGISGGNGLTGSTGANGAADGPSPNRGGQTAGQDEAIFLVIDEDCIDNGNEPNDFSDVDVNDNKAELGVRDQLRFFEQNVGKRVVLYTGEVGDEGLHALKTIPNSWNNAGPTSNGTMNYVLAGPGLGATFPDDDREVLLDKIPNVTPLRATGLAMLVGETIFAVVYDSDVSINYSPLNGNLQGANLGIVAFRVIDIRERTDGSTGSLPKITVEIVDTDRIDDLYLFANAPKPESSSEPYDTKPPQNAGDVMAIPAP